MELIGESDREGGMPDPPWALPPSPFNGPEHLQNNLLLSVSYMGI
jgi:hypothetical protein